MRSAQSPWIASALMIGLACGCQRNAAEEQERSEEVRQEANQDVAETREAANQQVAEAKEEAAAKINEAERKRAEEIQAAEREPVSGVDRPGVIDRDPNRPGIQGETGDVAEARREAREDVNEARAEGKEDIAEARQDAMEERRDMLTWADGELKALDRSIDQTSAKAQNAAPELRGKIVAGLKDIRDDRDALVTEIKTIDNRAAKGLAPFKERLETKFEALDQRVDKLDDQL